MHWLSLYVCVCGGEGGGAMYSALAISLYVCVCVGGGYVRCIGYKPVRVCVD